MLRPSEGERHYETIHGSALATQIALSHSRAQTHPQRSTKDLVTR